MTTGDEVRRGRPRSIDSEREAPRLSFRISGDDMDELLRAMDAQDLKLSQVVRMIVHGWAEDRREAEAKRSPRVGRRVPAQ